LLKSNLRPDTGDNADNWAKGQGTSSISSDGWTYLTSSTAWFLLCDKGDHHLEFIERQPLTPDSWKDKDIHGTILSVSERFSVGFWDFRGVTGTEGA
jgi:hypothetical protein